METKEDYINYVKAQLDSIPKDSAKASYDTGYGLHITSEYLGDACDTMTVVCLSILKIRPPNMRGENWDIAWNECRQLVNGFIGGIT